MADLRDTAHRLFDASNKRDWDTIRSALHPEYTYIGPDGQEAHGIEAGLAAGWSDHAAGFPDMRLEVKTVYVDGDTAITEFDVRGTHTGAWLGVAPTGKKVEMSVCSVSQFRDGKVYRERDYVDTLGILAQLGVVQMPSP